MNVEGNHAQDRRRWVGGRRLGPQVLGEAAEALQTAATESSGDEVVS
jgi:hypothetical protein